MKRVFSWHSPALDREMPVGCWGDFGKPILLFPANTGDIGEVEKYGLVEAVGPFLAASRAKLYAVESVSPIWQDEHTSPVEKARIQAAYDRYLVSELLPFIRHDCGETAKGIGVAGASMGAYNAVNAAAKHPEFINLCIGMSGTYQIDRWMRGHWDENLYFNQPLQFLPNLTGGPQLEALRRSRFMLAAGTGRWEEPDETARMGEVLRRCEIPCEVEIWGRDAEHDWPTWRTMLPTFLDRMI